MNTPEHPHETPIPTSSTGVTGSKYLAVRPQLWADGGLGLINGGKTMKEPLTDRQRVVFETIKAWIDINGWPPTRSELAKALGFASPNAAEEHLKAMARKGHIIMVPKVSRGIRIVA